MRLYISFILCLWLNFINGQNQLPFLNGDQNLILDGNLNESFWDNAVALSNFKQLTPHLGAEPSQNTSAYLIYDDDYLYVGIRCHFTNVKSIYSRILERDAVQDGDDYVEVHIDTYNDKSNSLVFRTNPLAAKYDYEVNQNGAQLNASWDTFWDAKTMKADDGWSAELKIPFSSLRYNPEHENPMAIKIVANYKFINETVISHLKELNIDRPQYHYSNSEEYILKNLPKNKTLYITPYIKGSVLNQNVLNVSQNEFQNETEWFLNNNFVKNRAIDKIISNIGLDVKYKLSSNHTIDLTLNTDFAQAEADEQIINLTRFSVLLPEKREFFLENAEFFNSSRFTHRLFNSRQIGISNGKVVPIIGGIRYLGSSKNLQFGIISMQTHEVEDANLPSHNMANIRAKLNLKNGSYIGLIGTGKTSLSRTHDYNYMGAFDGLIQTKKNMRFDFALAASFDTQRGQWKPMYSVGLNNIGKQGWAVEMTLRDYFEDFAPELGFIAKPNTKRVTFYHEWRKLYTADTKGLQRLVIGNYYQKEWVSSNGLPGYYQADIYSSYKFKNGLTISAGLPVFIGDHLYQPWNIAKNIIIPEGHYKTLSSYFILRSGNANTYRFTFNSYFGQFYGGQRVGISPSIAIDASKNLSTELGLNYNRLQFPRGFSANNSSKATILNRMYTRFKYSFSSTLFMNTYIQYDNSANTLGGNLRLRYTPFEGTDLYVVYNVNMNTERELMRPQLPTINNQSLIIKFSKIFIK